MSRNTSVSLGDHFVSFIDAQVKGGRYGSASDVVRAGLQNSFVRYILPILQRVMI